MDENSILGFAYEKPITHDKLYNACINNFSYFHNFSCADLSRALPALYMNFNMHMHII